MVDLVTELFGKVRRCEIVDRMRGLFRATHPTATIALFLRI